MNFNELLLSQQVDPASVIVLRHRPDEPELRNAYQQHHSLPLEQAMALLAGKGFIASFIGHEPGLAKYVGLYSIGRAGRAAPTELTRRSAVQELTTHGSKSEPSGLWFELEKTEVYQHWAGKLIVGWPPPDRTWWRRANRSAFPVVTVLDESALVTRG